MFFNAPISINVYGIDYENEKVFPLHVSKHQFKGTSIDLLCVKNGTVTTTASTSSASTSRTVIAHHYCLIRNFSRLVRSQVTSDKRLLLFLQTLFMPLYR